MKIDIDRLSELSYLSFNDSEKETLIHDMEELIGFAQKISDFSAELDGGTPFFAHSEVNVLRDDEPRPFFNKEKLLESADSTCNSFICVPLIISEEEDKNGH